MRILVINCHSDNRGDEAAVHAMVDEISVAHPEVEIILSVVQEQNILICRPMLK